MEWAFIIETRFFLASLVVLSVIYGLTFWLLIHHPRVQAMPGRAFHYFYSSIGIFTMFLFPVLSMRSISEERKTGRMLWLNSKKINFKDLLIGKFLAIYLFFNFILILILPLIAWCYAQAGYLDGNWLLGLPALAISGWAYLGLSFLGSSLTRNSIMGIFLSVIIILLFWFLGWISTHIYPPYNSWVYFLSIFNHYENIAQGRIHLNGIIYLITIPIISLFIISKTEHLKKQL